MPLTGGAPAYGGTRGQHPQRTRRTARTGPTSTAPTSTAHARPWWDRPRLALVGSPALGVRGGASTPGAREGPSTPGPGGIARAWPWRDRPCLAPAAPPTPGPGGIAHAWPWWDRLRSASGEGRPRPEPGKGRPRPALAGSPAPGPGGIDRARPRQGRTCLAPAAPPSWPWRWSLTLGARGGSPMPGGTTLRTEGREELPAPARDDRLPAPGRPPAGPASAAGTSPGTTARAGRRGGSITPTCGRPVRRA